MKKIEFKWEKNVNYVVISELPLEQQAPFTKWLGGQTAPVVQEEGENAFNCAYKWDYDRWLPIWNKSKSK